MFTSDDWRGVIRTLGCLTIVVLVCIIGLAFVLGRCSSGKQIVIQDVPQKASKQ